MAGRLAVSGLGGGWVAKPTRAPGGCNRLFSVRLAQAFQSQGLITQMAGGFRRRPGRLGLRIAVQIRVGLG